MYKKTSIIITDILVCLIIAAISASAYIWFPQYAKGMSVYAIFTLEFVVLTTLLFLSKYVLKKLSRPEACKANAANKLGMFFANRRSLLILTLIIFACWLPVLIILFPGTLANDTWTMIGQFCNFIADGRLHKGVFWDHHPITDTVFIGAIIVPLARVTGSWHVSFFTFVIFQAIITAFSYACIVDYAGKKLKLNPVCSLVLLLMYCFVPIYPISVQNIGKDPLFSWIFTFFMLAFCETVRSRGEALKDVRFLVVFTLLAVACCMTKKVGIYVILISFGAMLIFQKGGRKRLLVPIGACVIIMYMLIPGVIRYLGAGKGGVQEMFSLPFQMTARYVKDHPDDIKDDEYALLDRVLGMDDLAERYDPVFADPVKGYIERTKKSDYAAYIGVWVKQGLRHPDSYIAAADAMMSEWFSLLPYIPGTDMDWHNMIPLEWIPESVAQRTFNERFARGYAAAVKNLANNPLFMLFLSMGSYATFVPAFTVLTAVQKRRNSNIRYWLLTIPILLSIILGCWLAPTSFNLEGMRYLFPVTYTSPLLIMWCAFAYSNDYRNE